MTKIMADITRAYILSEMDTAASGATRALEELIATASMNLRQLKAGCPSWSAVAPSAMQADTTAAQLVSLVGTAVAAPLGITDADMKLVISDQKSGMAVAREKDREAT